MHSVTDEQIDFILSDIEKRGIVTEDVKYNILDHVCCIIENELPAGGNFYEFYKNTIARFYRKELSEIEQETQDLLTFKYYYAMKRTMKITGFLSAFLIIIGAVSKVLHLPGAGVEIVLGLAIFSLVFIPLNVVMIFRDDKEKKNGLIMAVGLGTTAVACIGILFKIMHWPFATILFDASILLFAVVFIPVYFFSKFKDPETKFNGIITTVFMIAGCGMLFALLNQKPSQHVMNSVESMNHYQDHNAGLFRTNNASLYTEVGDAGNEDVENLKMITDQLLSRISEIRTQLIAKSNDISEDEAKDLSAADIDNPHDYLVIEKHFTNGKGDLSFEGFKQAVAKYNKALKGLNNENVLRPVNLDKLQMTHTMVSVVLHELVDIEVQVLANENSFLCLKKGLLVQN